MSNLLNRGTVVPVYMEPEGIKYKFAEQSTETLMRMFWMFDSIPLGQDLEDYNKADMVEREFIKNTMMLFTQNEVLVNHGYVKMASIFKPNEIVNWCLYAGSTEVTHQRAYSLFTETLGLPNSIYTDFLDINVMSTKSTYLEKAKVYKWEYYKEQGLSDAEADMQFRRAVARMLAIYGGGAELTSLYAQFAMLLAFQTEGKYPGLCQIVEYSIKDELTHGKTNCELFRVFINENQDIWDDELKYDIYEGMRELVAYEEALINYLNPPHLSNEDCIKYVHFQADNALKELGMKTNWHVLENPFPFMEEVTGVILSDFFSTKVTSYSRNMTGSRDGLRAKLKSTN